MLAWGLTYLPIVATSTQAQSAAPPTAVAKSAETHDKAILAAVRASDVNRASSLLEQGANPDTTTGDRNSRSLLIMATILGDLEMAKLLLANRASVDQQDADGLTALNWAALRGRTAVAKLLLEHHASVDMADQQEVTPLLYAIGTRNRELSQLLLARGANPNVESKANKITALLLAVENRDGYLAGALLEHGAAVNGSNSDGYSALMAASEAGDLAMVELLLSYGALPELTDHKDRTAENFAQREGHDEIVALLRTTPGQ